MNSKEGLEALVASAYDREAIAGQMACEGRAFAEVIIEAVVAALLGEWEDQTPH